MYLPIDPSGRWRVVREADGRGRRVVAGDRGFKAGEIVLSDEPYAWVSYQEARQQRRCDCCLAPSETALLRCSACKQAYYLNREHQARAWKAGHKEECTALRAVAPRMPPPTALLALRAALRHLQEEQQQRPGSNASGQPTADSSSGSSSCRYAEVQSLEPHWADMPDTAKLRCAHLGALACSLLAAATGSPAATPDSSQAGAGTGAEVASQAADEGGSMPELPAAAAATALEAAAGADAAASGPGSARELALLIALFACNAHTICDDELSPLGVGIYPLGSMVNHSCMPNAAQSFHGSTIHFRALRDIAPGEEVTIAYVELAATRWERRAALLQQYYFDLDAAPVPQQQEQPQQQQQPQEQEQSPTHQDQQQPRSSPQLEPQAGSSEQLPGGGRLSYHGSSQPPWPADLRDTAFSALVLVGAGSAGSTQNSSSGGSSRSSSSSSSKVEGMVGGIWGDLQEAEADSSLAEESFELPSSAGASLQDGRPRADKPAGTPTLHCWGLQEPRLRAAAAALAQRYASALQLLAEADGLIAGGEQAAAAAAQQLQQALASLSVPTTSSASASSASSTSSTSSSAALALGPHHILRLRLLAAQLRAAVAAGLWPAALASARALLPLYRAAYPPAWPSLALHLATLAKLEHLQGEGQPGAALAAAEAALRMLRLTHGLSPAVSEVERIRTEAVHELQHLASLAGSRGGAAQQRLPAAG